MLAGVSTHLQNRYAALAALRAPLRIPVYAFEHDLPPAQIADLKAEASRKLQREGLRDADWLIWIALAAEAGYSYAGEEFWPQLETTTEEWRPNDRRNKLREWYRSFRKRFQGPIPVGRWAEHFSIISWPVANAVLPVYLQTLFARHLYDFREEVAGQAAREPVGIGDLLHRRYLGNSSRLEDFLEQTELTTQVVLALRDEDQGEATSRISPGALARIVGDLSRRREAREYLSEARNVLRAGRVRFAGSGRVGARSVSETKVPTVSVPRFAAIRTEDGVTLAVTIPRVDTAMADAGLSAALLRSARVRFAGPNERWSPADILLTWAGRERELAAFPATDALIFDVSGATDQLSMMLKPSMQIEERPFWLLRRQTDGIFYEVLGAQVRALQSYILICRGPVPDNIAAAAGFRQLPIKGGGAFAYSFDNGPVIGESPRQAFHQIGISVALGAIIDPVGLNPRIGLSGRPVWLSTETIAFRCSADFPVEAYIIGLNGEPSASISAVDKDFLFSISGLVKGNYTLTVGALPKSSATQAPKVHPTDYLFEVEAPQPWQASVRERAGIRLICAPNATFDSILGRRTSISILGPVGRKVSWSLELFDASGHIFKASQAKSLAVTASPDDVANGLRKLAEGQEDAIESAYRVDIVAAIDELGRQVRSFPHKATPVRWLYDAKTNKIRLIDELTHEKPLEVRVFALNEPLRGVKIAVADAIAGVAVSAPGALLEAKLDKRTYCLLATTPQRRVDSFSGLQIQQTLTKETDDARSLRALIRGIRRWERARAVGPLAILRKDQTRGNMERDLRRICVGSEFAGYIQTGTVEAFTVAQGRIAASPGFGLRMRTYLWSADPVEAAAQFLRFARLYRIETEEVKCLEAIRLAFDPASLRMGKLETDLARLATLLASQALLQGAFLAKAATDLRQVHNGSEIP
jgi:hypothetical protein